MIRCIYTDSLVDGQVIRVEEWPNKDRLDGAMVRQILRHAVQEARTCASTICSFDVLRVGSCEDPLFETILAGEREFFMMTGDSLLFGYCSDDGYIRHLHYGRSHRANQDGRLRYGLTCGRDSRR